MGLAICKKHGESGVIGNISLDICQDLQNAISDITGIVVVTIDIFDDDEFLYSQKNYISKKIFEESDLKKKYKITNEEQEAALNVIFPSTSGMCGKCFEEYVIRNDISIEK